MEQETIQFLKILLNKCKIHFTEFQQLNGLFIPRDILLNMDNYKTVVTDIDELKQYFSSSNMTCLQKTATKNQRWPLLNLVRQILKAINYKLKPIRKSDGYTKDGVKKYKRYFQIIKMTVIQIDISNVDQILNAGIEYFPSSS